MKGDRDTPSTYSPDNHCAECGKGISPAQARTSEHSTHEIGGGRGRALCRRCLDRENRPSRAAINGRSSVW